MTERYSIRDGTVADVETIVRHRRKMFFDMGKQDSAVLDEMSNSFRPWLAEKISKREYLSWFAIAEGGSVAAGAGLWLMNWPPGLYTSDRGAETFSTSTRSTGIAGEVWLGGWLPRRRIGARRTEFPW